MTGAALVAVGVVVFAAAIVQATSGFGFALFSVPLIAALVGPKEAVAISALLGTLSTVRQFVQFRRVVHWRLARRLSLAALVGMPVGVVILLALEDDVLRLVMALTVVALTALLWRGVTLSVDTWGLDLVAGFVAGVLNTSVGTNGPPLVLSLQARGLEPDPFRGTISAVFAVCNSVTVVLLALAGQITTGVLALSAVAVVPLIAGMIVGRSVQRRLHPRHFRRIVLWLLLASAAAAVATSVVGIVQDRFAGAAPSPKEINRPQD